MRNFGFVDFLPVMLMSKIHHNFEKVMEMVMFDHHVSTVSMAQKIVRYQ